VLAAGVTVCFDSVGYSEHCAMPCSAARRTFGAASCTWRKRKLSVASSVACCRLHVVGCMLHVVCCMVCPMLSQAEFVRLSATAAPRGRRTAGGHHRLSGALGCAHALLSHRSASLAHCMRMVLGVLTPGHFRPPRRSHRSALTRSLHADGTRSTHTGPLPSGAVIGLASLAHCMRLAAASAALVAS
jgi:hypothetical protein